jgi:hypothetical protein
LILHTLLLSGTPVAKEFSGKDFCGEVVGRKDKNTFLMRYDDGDGKHLIVPP